MKIILYIRRHPKHPARATMKVRSEDEPCYDSPRILNLGAEIAASLQGMIDDCEAQGCIAVNTRKETR